MSEAAEVHLCQLVHLGFSVPRVLNELLGVNHQLSGLLKDMPNFSWHVHLFFCLANFAVLSILILTMVCCLGSSE